MFYVFNLILPCILINGIGEYKRVKPINVKGAGFDAQIMTVLVV